MPSVFERCSANPIVTRDSFPFAAAAAYNPGVAQCEDHIVLLLRVKDDAGYSSIYVARSSNGVTDWQIEPEPFLKYGEEAWRYEEWVVKTRARRLSRKKTVGTSPTRPIRRQGRPSV